MLANGRMLGMSEHQFMRHVYWPSALSWMFSSLHTSVGFAVVGAVVGEYLGSAAGLGYLIQQAEGVFDVAGVFAGMFVLAAFVMVIDRPRNVVERRPGVAPGCGRGRVRSSAKPPTAMLAEVAFSRPVHCIIVAATERRKPCRESASRLAGAVGGVDADHGPCRGAEQDHGCRRRRCLPVLSADRARQAARRVREGRACGRARRPKGRLGRAQGRARRADADVVSGYFDHCVNLAARKQELVSFVVYDRYPGLVLVVAPSHAGEIKSIKDLAGKKVGVSAPGSSTDFFLKYLLKKNGLDPTGAAVIGVGLGATAVAAMEQGQIDAAVMLDPAVTVLQGSHPDLKILADTRTQKDTLAMFGGEYPGGALYSTAAWVSMHEGGAGADERDRRHVPGIDRIGREIMAETLDEMVGKDKALIRSVEKMIRRYRRRGRRGSEGRGRGARRPAKGRRGSRSRC